jgi:hypothetical protein
VLQLILREHMLNTRQIANWAYGTGGDNGEAFTPPERLTYSQLFALRRAVHKFCRDGMLYRTGRRDGYALWSSEPQ